MSCAGVEGGILKFCAVEVENLEAELCTDTDDTLLPYNRGPTGGVLSHGTSQTNTSEIYPFRNSVHFHKLPENAFHLRYSRQLFIRNASTHLD
jgi:hypothetical protein